EDVEIVRFNPLSALDIDEEIGLEEEDEDREIDESTIKVLHNITDICTRWNSSYYLWTRLLELKDAITWLASVLPLKKRKENKRDTPSPPPDLDQIEKQFKIAIYNSLNKYWYDFREVGLVATLLDLRTKRMSAFTNREREKAETKLRNEFENLQRINNTSNDQPVQQTSSTVIEIMQNLFFEDIFGVQGQEDIPLDEVARYLKITPINNYNVNS
ncbi:16785_t:CDS:2, partial [Racocetra fulgida]